ncbi:MAG: hypothetical protein KKG09_10785 [Verrucomicrobia bacterium]|nr:hypothetical protein [Verrucomicrobiota bacterium]MBU4292135.1 hypothetical protein [Verrucomicrobiota bacterium]MBU4428932.1 hypothetical protein [Verrucomicrobiota bacterium]MBU4498478.1 hypothetical protein [Verrucomicrobiota bacterium]
MQGVAAIAVLAGLALLASCRSHTVHNKPPWIGQPKGNDSVYVYAVGNALNRASAAAAREAAHQDALRQLAAQVSPDTKSARLRGVEILPGCVYYDEHDDRFDCWVQVSWPVAEKNKLIGQSDRRPDFRP